MSAFGGNMKKIELSLILPCYNEAEHFSQSAERILQALKKSKLGFEIIFVEDKSTDKTVEFIKSFINKYPNESLRAVFHTQNQGRGQTVIDGIKKAQGTYVGFIDIDCEVSPTYVPEFIKKLREGYDVACGLRFYNFEMKSVLRWLASETYRKINQIMLGHPLKDTEAGFKFFKKSAVVNILKLTSEKHWFWDTEVMVYAWKSHLKIVEIPVEFIRRSDKTSTVNLVSDSIDYIKKLWQFRRKLNENG